MAIIQDRRLVPITPRPYDIKDIGPSGTPQARAFEQTIQQPSGSAQFLAKIADNSDINMVLQTIGLGFSPRVINVAPITTSPPTLLIEQNFAPRGYVIQNPGELSGFSSQVTFFPLLARAENATYTSTPFNVSGTQECRLWLNITVNAVPLDLTVNVQTQDPLSGNWADAQLDIFSGNNAVGTYYADIGSIGVDRSIRLQAVVGAGGGADTITFSISGLLKGISTTPVGSTVYIGNPDVNPTFGFAILPGDNFFFYLRENVALYGITATETLALKVFQLQ